jgi:hypothetical protein
MSRQPRATEPQLLRNKLAAMRGQRRGSVVGVALFGSWIRRTDGFAPDLRESMVVHSAAGIVFAFHRGERTRPS